jgi:hypothetical protein
MHLTLLLLHLSVLSCVSVVMFSLYFLFLGMITVALKIAYSKLSNPKKSQLPDGRLPRLEQDIVQLTLIEQVRRVYQSLATSIRSLRLELIDS